MNFISVIFHLSVRAVRTSCSQVLRRHAVAGGKDAFCQHAAALVSGLRYGA